MPEKLGNGGNSLEKYDPKTGKYIEDGKPNKYYENKAEQLFGVQFQKDKTLSEQGFNNTFKLPQKQLDYIKEHPYFKDTEMQTVPLEKLIKDNNLDNPDELSDRNIADMYISSFDSSKDSPIRGVIDDDGRIRIADGRHRVYALYKSGYDSVEMPIKRDYKNIGEKTVNTEKTGMSYYDQLLPNSPEKDYMERAKNLKGEIVEMSPDEYFKKCAEDIFGTSVEKLKEQRKLDQDSSPLNDVLESGGKLDMPMINYANKGQEGLHRMMVLGEKYGWDTKFPVLQVNFADINREKDWRNSRIDRAIENIQDDIAEQRVYDKESFLKKLNQNLNWNFQVEDKGNKFIVSDGLVSQEFSYPKFEEDEDDFDLDDLLEIEDLEV